MVYLFIILFTLLAEVRLKNSLSGFVKNSERVCCVWFVYCPVIILMMGLFGIRIVEKSPSIG